MGAVNYSTSDYITLAIEPYDADEILESWEECGDSDCLDEIESEDEKLRCISRYIEARYETDFENVDYEIEHLTRRFFKISIEPGYNEGYSLKIELDYDFADYAEKREAQKEITEIKAFLHSCIDMGWRVCHPGLCATFLDYDESLGCVPAAIREMREAVRTSDTDYTYKRRLTA